MVVRARILISVLSACLLTAEFAYAAVSAQLSAQDIDELESVVLTIRASDTRQTETLDLAALNSDFEVLNTNTSSNYRFVNGREQSWVDYQITLQPKRVGELTVPGVKIGRDTTPSMTLRVRKLSASMRDSIERKVFFESEVSANTIYVQAQLVLTRRLFYSQGVQLYSDLPGPPEIEDAVVLTLGETTSAKTTRDGLPYGVIEQRYAIFPESSGEFTIPSVNITASVRLTENGRSSRKGVRVATDANKIVIKPVPAAYPTDQPWLPATNVRVLQAIENSDGVNVGDTLLHEFVIQVVGNVGSAAPPQQLELADTEFRTYPQAPTIQDDTNGASVVGARLQTTSLVPLIPGTLQVPPTTVFWWNTETDSLERATTEPLTFNVEGQAITQTDDTSSDENVIATPVDDELTDAEPISLPPEFSDPANLRYLFTLLACLLVAVFLYRYRSPLVHRLATRAKGIPRLRDLQQAKTDHEFYEVLLYILRTAQDKRRLPSVDALVASHPQVSPILSRLRTDLYSRDTDTTASPTLTKQERRTVIDALQQYLGHHRAMKNTHSLPPLYPSDHPA